MGLSVVLAVVSLVLALRSAFLADVVRIDIAPGPVLPQSTGLLRAVVFGVLAGVAFFTGLACFFWSAAVQARQQRAELIKLLEQWPGHGESGATP